MIDYIINRKQRKWAIDSLHCYWNRGSNFIESLKMPVIGSFLLEHNVPRVHEIIIPEWAEDLASDGYLLIPKAAVSDGNNPEWMRTDWVAAIIWYLDGVAERYYEKKYGPIHSYSFRLKGWDQRMWERAWVNRIALFLRRWAAREEGVSEEDLFGPLPSSKIVLTHDVDAIRKTFAIRCKQSAFNAYNAGKLIVKGRPRRGLKKLGKAIQFFTSSDDYWCFDKIIELEEKHGIKSIFTFYAGNSDSANRLVDSLIDPGYSVVDDKVKAKARHIADLGWQVGLHTSNASWNRAEDLKRQKQVLESALNQRIRSARVHWLKFSWEKTWQLLDDAGIESDMTLGFNDRPAFRNAAALEYSPWCKSTNMSLELRAVPTILMDSHLYDYKEFTDSERDQEMIRWVREIKDVRGEASIIWHTHVMSSDYGWASGYHKLLSLL